MNEATYVSWAAVELHYDSIVLDKTLFPIDPNVL